MAAPVDLSRYLVDRPQISGYTAHRRLPAHATRTFEIATSRTTHYRPATCEEAGCQALAAGWRVVCAATPEGRAMAARIRRECRPAGAQLSPVLAARIRRRYTLTRDPAGAEVYEFAPGMPCFTPHRVPLERPAFYIVRDGDARGNPRGTAPYRHANGDDWVEDNALHLQVIAREHEKG